MITNTIARPVINLIRSIDLPVRALHELPRNALLIRPIALASVLFITACEDSSGPTPHPGYRLSTSFQGEDIVLTADISTSDEIPPVLLAAADGITTQDWVITIKDNGSYNIYNSWLGDDYSLDVVNDGVNDRIHLAPTGDYSGQSWNFTALENGYCRITNNFTGTEIALDIRNDTDADANEPFLAIAGDFSGQQWRIAEIDGSDALIEPFSQCTGESSQTTLFGDAAAN